MFKRCFAVVVLAALVFLPAASTCGQSAPKPQWVSTWATASMLPDDSRPSSNRMLSGVTLRQIAHISAGGAQVRIRFTNEFGLDPLTIGDAHVALSAGGSSIQPGSDHVITFGGAGAVNVPPGGAIFSDPVALQVAPLADVAVTAYLPPQIMRAETFHYYADRDNFIAMGDVANAQDLPQSTTFTNWFFFDGIDVTAAPDSYSIVALGDSITDGWTSTRNANRRCSTRAMVPAPSRASTAMCLPRTAFAMSSCLRASTTSPPWATAQLLPTISLPNSLSGDSGRLSTPHTSTASTLSAPQSCPTATTPQSMTNRCAKP